MKTEKIYDSKTRLYNIYNKMKGRCNLSRDTNYKNYGGRGIKIDSVWNNFKAFKLWSLSNGYTDDLQIDRIENDGNYTPQNCRWVPQIINIRNRNKIKGKNKYTGVYKRKYAKVFSVRITVNYKPKNLGTFKTEKEAVYVRNKFISNNPLLGFNTQPYEK